MLYNCGSQENMNQVTKKKLFHAPGLNIKSNKYCHSQIRHIVPVARLESLRALNSLPRLEEFGSQQRRPQCFGKWKMTSMTSMKDNLKYLKIEDDLNF